MYLICSADHSGKNGCKPEEAGIDTTTYAGSCHEGGVEVWKEPPPWHPLHWTVMVVNGEEGLRSHRDKKERRTVALLI